MPLPLPSLITKTFASFAIRIVTIDGNPWFVAADVCKALGIYQRVHKGYQETNTYYVKSLLSDDQWLVQLPPSSARGEANRPLLMISESGLYKLVMRSDKPDARPFQDWVTRDVLPAIRKDGSYVLGEEKVATGEMTEDELIFRAMEAMKRKMDRLAVEKAEAEAKLVEQQPKVELADKFLSAKGSITTTEVAAGRTTMAEMTMAAGFRHSCHGGKKDRQAEPPAFTLAGWPVPSS